MVPKVLEKRAEKPTHRESGLHPQFRGMKTRAPRILFVTPEISYLDRGMCRGSQRVRAKAGGLADVAALLVSGLTRQGYNLHLALPHYRHLFRDHTQGHLSPVRSRILEGSRMHLAEDSQFYRKEKIYQDNPGELLRSALIFQREVINRIIPKVRPDLIHCNDWMTGLIPAAAKKMGIPSLFTIHNIHTQHTTLAELEGNGIPGEDFWDGLYYESYPRGYREAYASERIDLLASGIHAADQVNVVSPSFLEEIMRGEHRSIPGNLSHLLWAKHQVGAASGVLNAPDPSFDSTKDPALACRYSGSRHREGKARNKKALQRSLGLAEDPEAPILLWPSRLDPVQKGCQLLTEILYRITEDYRSLNLQIAVVADGPFRVHFETIRNLHRLDGRLAIRSFSEPLSRLGYAGSDFVLMPSSFEPCGLPQMIGSCYGSLPVVHRTGGLRDTVEHLDAHAGTGNGFVFENFDSNGLRWAIAQAIRFFNLPTNLKERQIARIIRESTAAFSPSGVLDAYKALYQKVEGFKR